MCSRDLKPQLISILSKKRQRLVVAEKTTTGSINQKNVAPSEILAAIWSPSTVELRQAIEIVKQRFHFSFVCLLFIYFFFLINQNKCR